MAENSPVLLIVIFYLAICANAIEINCGGRLTDQAGSLSSPNIGGNYPNNAYCVWYITVASGQVIDLRFKTLDLDRTGDQSCKDYVEVYDGRSENDLRLGDRYCGFSSDSGLAAVKIRSSSNVMLVTFKSDDRVTRTGFTASYWAHDCPPFMYGDEKCNTSCICHKNNTNYCDNFDGQCYCKNGWLYSDCSVLQNYCTEPNTCPGPYSKCISLPGGHDNVCPIGMALENDRCIDSATCTKKNCSQACGVTSDNPRIETCYCPKGMKLNSTDNSTCFDVCQAAKTGEESPDGGQENPRQAEVDFDGHLQDESHRPGLKPTSDWLDTETRERGPDDGEESRLEPEAEDEVECYQPAPRACPPDTAENDDLSHYSLSYGFETHPNPSPQSPMTSPLWPTILPSVTEINGADGTHSDVPARIFEHFIKFILVESSTGEHLFNTLIRDLEMLGLDVENIRGQGYDNGANLKGHNILVCMQPGVSQVASGPQAQRQGQPIASACSDSL
uniref:CUB domain-containing protein n=1 Tax=Biomphalaria glabrata TaxID=6526 RepID=A0A2C9KX45_BIOGL